MRVRGIVPPVPPLIPEPSLRPLGRLSRRLEIKVGTGGADGAPNSSHPFQRGSLAYGSRRSSGSAGGWGSTLRLVGLPRLSRRRVCRSGRYTCKPLRRTPDRVGTRRRLARLSRPTSCKVDPQPSDATGQPGASSTAAISGRRLQMKVASAEATSCAVRASTGATCIPSLRTRPGRAVYVDWGLRGQLPGPHRSGSPSPSLCRRSRSPNSLARIGGFSPIRPKGGST